MVADHQKNMLETAKVDEHLRRKGKRKRFSADGILSLSSHIQLQWEETQNKVVAKREQVGITWRDMAPFVDFVPKSRSPLADVISVPREIFDLDNLIDVLSYEVWEDCLTESDRELLGRFLPSGTSAEQVLHSLFTGENHHFGNPFLKWSTSLCSSKLHPDAVLRNVRKLRASKNMYISKLNDYHTDMIRVLSKSSERLRKRNRANLTVSTRRPKAAPVAKEELPPIICIRNGDDVKHIRISWQEFQLISKTKHGNQIESLRHVLGDIKGLSLQPYTISEEEEKQKLHQHWVQLATRSIPEASKCRNDKKLQKAQWAKSLHRELAEKMISSMVVPKMGEHIPKLATEHLPLLRMNPHESSAKPMISSSDTYDSCFQTSQESHGWSLCNKRQLTEERPVPGIHLQGDILPQQGHSLDCSYSNISHLRPLSSSYVHQHTNNLDRLQLQYANPNSHFYRFGELHHEFQSSGQVRKHQILGKSWAGGKQPFPHNQHSYGDWSRPELHGGQYLVRDGVNESQWNSNLPYEAMSLEQLMQARNFTGGEIPSNNSIYAHQPAIEPPPLNNVVAMNRSQHHLSFPVRPRNNF